MSWTVDMGRYGGGRGKKMPKIGDLLYGWPLGLIYTKLPFCIFRKRNLQNPDWNFSRLKVFGEIILYFENLRTKFRYLLKILENVT